MGKFIQVGIVGHDITLDYDTVLYKQIQLFGSLAHSMKTWDRVMQILEQKKVNLAPIITHKCHYPNGKKPLNYVRKRVVEKCCCIMSEKTL